ncbi:hypothetical protein bcgnr5413_01460 [Bacillus cereus]
MYIKSYKITCVNVFFDYIPPDEILNFGGIYNENSTINQRRTKRSFKYDQRRSNIRKFYVYHFCEKL